MLSKEFWLVQRITPLSNLNRASLVLEETIASKAEWRSVVGDSEVHLRWWRTFQLRHRRPWAVVSYTLLAAMPWNEHDVTVWNIRVREHGYGRRSNGMVGVYLRGLRSNRYSLHRIDTSPKLLTPSGLFSYPKCSKNAEHDGFNFDTKTFRLANASSSPVL